MHASVVYRVTVSGQCAGTFEHFFVELPTLEEIAEAIEGEIERQAALLDQNGLAEGEIDMICQSNDDLCRLVELVRASGDLAGSITEVIVAGVAIGTISVSEVPASTRLCDRRMLRLCA